MTYEELKAANEQIKTLDLKGKAYAEVNQRVKAFRICYPEGFIKTSIEVYTDTTAMIRACCGYYSDGAEVILGTGTAFEERGSNFVNKVSYLENAETSAVGRALGMAGFGIDTSIASFEEVENAIEQQTSNKDSKAGKEQKIKLKSAYEEYTPELITPEQLEILEPLYKGERLDKLLKANKVDNLAGLTKEKAGRLIDAINEMQQKKGAKE